MNNDIERNSISILNFDKKKTRTNTNKQKMIRSQWIIVSKCKFSPFLGAFSMQQCTLGNTECVFDILGRQRVQLTYFFIDLNSTKCGKRIKSEVVALWFSTTNICCKMFYTFFYSSLIVERKQKKNTVKDKFNVYTDKGNVLELSLDVIKKIVCSI